MQSYCTRSSLIVTSTDLPQFSLSFKIRPLGRKATVGTERNVSWWHHKKDAYGSLFPVPSSQVFFPSACTDNKDGQFAFCWQGICHYSSILAIWTDCLDSTRTTYVQKVKPTQCSNSCYLRAMRIRHPCCQDSAYPAGASLSSPINMNASCMHASSFLLICYVARFEMFGA